MFWLNPDTGYKWINKNKEEKFKFTIKQNTAPEKQIYPGMNLCKGFNYWSIFSPQGVGFLPIKKIIGNKYHNEIFNREDLSWNELEKWEILSCEI